MRNESMWLQNGPDSVVRPIGGLAKQKLTIWLEQHSD